nr:MAG TPA_asm: hypothetical protein [Bacteriophage sp.]
MFAFLPYCYYLNPKDLFCTSGYNPEYTVPVKFILRAC